jgi:calcineurin-like phosphoesterase
MLSLHHAGIVVDISILLFHAETTVKIQLDFAFVIASQTTLVLGSQIHPKLIFIILIQFIFA